MHLPDAILRRARAWSEAEIVVVGALAAIAAAAFTIAIYVNYPRVPFARELTGGFAVWSDANKVRDVAILPIGLVAFVAIFAALLISPLSLGVQARRFVSLVRKPRVDVETVEAASVIVATAILAAYGQIDLFLAAAVAWHLVYRRRFLRRQGVAASSIEILVAVLVIDAVSRLAGVAQAFSVQALIVSAVVEEALLRLPANLFGPARRVMAVAGYAAVAWWSLQFLPLWRVPDVVFGPALPPLIVSIVIMLLAAALFADGVRRAYSDNAERGLYGPAIAIALALCLKHAMPSALTLPTDDYHYGEGLWPLWQALEFGQRLFVDVVPVHGLNDLAGAAVAEVLFGNLTGTNVLIGSAYADLVILGLAGLTLSRRLPIGLVFFLLLVLAQSTALVVAYMTLVLLIVQSPRFSRLIPVYLLLSAGMSFAVTGPGSAAVAASIVPVALRGGLEFRRDRQSFLTWLAATIGLAAALLIFFHEPVRHHLAYILVSAETNLTIYGKPWDASFVSGRPDWSLEWRRYSWTLLIALLPIMMAMTWKRSAPAQAKVGIIAGLAYLLAFLLLNDSYANGRIDPGGISRPGLTGVVAWVLFATFGAPAFRTTVDQKAAVGFAVVMLAALLGFVPYAREKLPIRPFERPSEPPLISERLPAMGFGSADAGSLRRAEIVKEVMDALLEPDETFLDVTNRTALYFYTGRPSPIPITAVYNAAPDRFQKDAVKALRANRPPVVLLSYDSILHDGGQLPIRDYQIYRFVTKHYIPFYYKGAWFGTTKRARSRLERLNTKGALQFAAAAVTDDNWIAGIAGPTLSSTWSFVVQDKALFDLLRVGDVLRFADGSTRRIETLRWPRVKVSGPPLDPMAVGSPHAIAIEGRDPVAAASGMSTYDALFGPTQLRSLPSAWGRSYRLLDEQLVKRSDLGTPVATHDVKVRKGGWYKPTGADPFVVFDTPQRKGDEQGILGFDVRCGGPKSPDMIRMEIYWHAIGKEFSDERVIRFAANPGFQLVPMDSRISWAGARVAQLRIGLQRAKACERFRLDRTKLFRRVRSD